MFATHMGVAQDFYYHSVHIIVLLFVRCVSLGSVSKREKKLLAVQGDLAQKVIEIANRKGMTVYSFTNEVLEQAIKAESMNRSLEDIVERFRLLEIERDSGAVFTTKDVLLFMVEKLYQQEKEALLKRSYESGRWYGKYLQVKFHDGEPLDILEKLLDVGSDSSEIRIFRDGNKISLTRLCPHDSLEHTDLVSKYLEGIVHSFGYESKNNDVSKGLIILEFEKISKTEHPKEVAHETSVSSKPYK